MKYSDMSIAEEGIFSKIFKRFKPEKKTPISKPPVTVKRQDITAICAQIAEKYPELVKKEFENRKKFIAQIDKLKKDLCKNKSLGLWISPNTERGGYLDDDDAFAFMEDLLPGLNELDDTYSWAYTSDFVYPLYAYDIWEYANAKGLNARDMDTNNTFWDLAKPIDMKAISTLSKSEFFIALDCGGDWDDGTIDVVLQPSKQLLAIAQKEFGYKWKAPKVSSDGYIEH